MGLDVDFAKLPKSKVDPLKEGEYYWDYWDVTHDAIDLGYWMRRNYAILRHAASILLKNAEGNVRRLEQSTYYRITSEQLDELIELYQAEIDVDQAHEDTERDEEIATLKVLQSLRAEFDFDANYLTIKHC